MDITELVHTDCEGWAIVADIEGNSYAEDTTKPYRIWLLSMVIENGKPRCFSVPADFKPNNKNAESCDVRYTEIDDLKKIKRGDGVYYYINHKVLTGSYSPGQAGKVRYGTVRYVNHDTQNVILDDDTELKLVHLMQFEHNYEQVLASGGNVCKRCQQIHEGLRVAN